MQTTSHTKTARASVSTYARFLLLGAIASLSGCSGASEVDVAAQIRDDMRHLELGLKQFAGDKGRYPNELSDLIQPGAVYPRTEPRPELPHDPWGNEYVYVAPTGTGRANLICLGADALPGGEGPASDIDLVSLKR